MNNDAYRDITLHFQKPLQKMEAKHRKVGDVYPARGNRFQDKVEP